MGRWARGRVPLALGLVLLTGTLTWFGGTWVIGSHRARSDAERSLRAWSGPAPSGRVLRLGLADPPSGHPLGAGRTVAVLRLPRLGRSWQMPVREGVDAAVLRIGTGHYPGTAMPGELGNFAVAGHRTTWAHPFRRLDGVRPGDAVVVDTPWARLVYRVRSSLVVAPGDLRVLAGAATGSGPADRRTITLTTCTPLFSARSRLVVQGVYDPAASGLWVGG